MTPETQAILARGAVDALAIYARRESGKAVVPANGPDNVRIVDPVHGPNWGPALTK